MNSKEGSRAATMAQGDAVLYGVARAHRRNIGDADISTEGKGESMRDTCRSLTFSRNSEMRSWRQRNGGAANRPRWKS